MSTVTNHIWEFPFFFNFVTFRSLNFISIKNIYPQVSICLCDLFFDMVSEVGSPEIMVDRFKPPSMNWISPGDVLKRFELFKQKCEPIFEGPLGKVVEAKKARLLLLWIGDKGLEIYNANTWTNEGGDLKIAPVMAALEAYTKPQRNQILARYQLRCLKKGDKPLKNSSPRRRY